MSNLDKWKSSEGITDAEAASRLGISRPHFNKIRQGRGSLSLALLVRLHLVTGISTDQILKPWISKASAAGKSARKGAMGPSQSKVESGAHT